MPLGLLSNPLTIIASNTNRVQAQANASVCFHYNQHKSIFCEKNMVLILTPLECNVLAVGRKNEVAPQRPNISFGLEDCKTRQYLSSLSGKIVWKYVNFGRTLAKVTKIMYLIVFIPIREICRSAE